jgi:hypothetical protein
MSPRLAFDVNDDRLEFVLTRAIAAGYTGRNRVAVDHHVEELKQLGIAPPPRVPMLYPLIPSLVTNEPEIWVLGRDTTPEVEIALLRFGGVDYVTVASDHTDRVLERRSIPRAKNACAKVLGTRLWRLEEIADHWDALRLRSTCAGTVLQDGAASELLDNGALAALVESEIGDREGTVILGGTTKTLAAPSIDEPRIELSLVDPVTGREIRHAYQVRVLMPLFGEVLG